MPWDMAVIIKSNLFSIIMYITAQVPQINDLLSHNLKGTNTAILINNVKMCK